MNALIDKAPSHWVGSRTLIIGKTRKILFSNDQGFRFERTLKKSELESIGNFHGDSLLNIFCSTNVESMNQLANEPTLYIMDDGECTCGYVTMLKLSELMKSNSLYNNLNIIAFLTGNPENEELIKYKIKELSLLFPVFFIPVKYILREDLNELSSQKVLLVLNDSIYLKGSQVYNTKLFRKYLSQLKELENNITNY